MAISNAGTGLAGGLIVAALLDALLAKDILSKSEIRDVLRNALQAIAGDKTAYDAIQIITDLMGRKFSERG